MGKWEQQNPPQRWHTTHRHPLNGETAWSLGPRGALRSRRARFTPRAIWSLEGKKVTPKVSQTPWNPEISTTRCSCWAHLSSTSLTFLRHKTLTGQRDTKPQRTRLPGLESSASQERKHSSCCNCIIVVSINKNAVPTMWGIRPPTLHHKSERCKRYKTTLLAFEGSHHPAKRHSLPSLLWTVISGALLCVYRRYWGTYSHTWSQVRSIASAWKTCHNRKK